jgi:nitrate/TMAO reductase-like tetraheme cytochrome c subunit
MTPNNLSKGGRSWLSPLIHLSNNWISLVGVVLVTTTTVLWLFLLPVTLKGETENPYLGMLAFLTIPGPFFGGLILVPLGMWLKRRREGRTGIYPPEFPTPSWSNPELRKLVYFVGLTTLANVVIGSQLAYSAVNYMDSVSFCGKTCHTVMEPEFTAYQSSPHSRVECVKCHIGPGASWFVQSKLSGTRQLLAVTFKTYPRPIPTPVHNLRPARETCEACHWPQKYGEDRVRVINKFADDEANSLTKTVLLMKIGGGNHGIGIHGTHLGPGVTIRYAATDEQRQNIPWVEYNAPGRQTLYATADAKANGGGAPIRDMDCMDCHNRPSHSYDLPERGMDKAMAAGLISNTLPFVKKKGVEILKVNYPSRDEAARKIPAAFVKYYQDTYPAIYAQRQAEISASAKEVLAVWNRNIFPEMKVTWGAYPINIGHTDYPGCFRCHDGGHNAKDGKSISQDCNACHNLLAMDEAQPKILTDLGVVESKTK